MSCTSRAILIPVCTHQLVDVACAFSICLLSDYVDHSLCAVSLLLGGDFLCLFCTYLDAF